MLLSSSLVRLLHASGSVPPVLLLSSLVGALSAVLIVSGAIRTLYLDTVGRRRDRYSRLSRLGTGAQVPFFTSVLGEPPAVQHTVVKEDSMVPLDRDDPGYDPDAYQQKAEPRAFTVSIYLDRDYYVQTISDDDQTVLAYSVTTRSRRFRPSLRPVPKLGLHERRRFRRAGASYRPPPRIVLGRTRFADLDATEPEHFAPPRLRLRLGAHNFDYSEFAYYGNPGRYQSFVWSASDVARQGRLGDLASARAELPADEWSGTGDDEPDWSELIELQRFRRETAITTYTVCGTRLLLDNYPTARFGVGEHEVRTLG